MGVREKYFFNELIPERCDRDANRCYSYRMPNGECVIHFRNYKIVLHTEEEIREWKDGFTEALKKLKEGDYFKNDIA